MIVSKKIFSFCILLLPFATTYSQKQTADSLADYDFLFSDFQNFLDSLTQPRSFVTANMAISTAPFQFQTNSATTLQEAQRLILAPSLGYYHKSGFGIGAAASLLNKDQPLVWYQTAATASYDYLKKRAFLTGLSYTYFFTKQHLPFYTSPLNQQLYAYALYRNGWLKPALGAGFGWGSTTTLEERKTKLKLLKGGNRNATVRTETSESISDLVLSASVKHDFYWRHLFYKSDYVRLTPQLLVYGGTQKFGLSQTNNLYVSEKRTGNTVLYGSEKQVSTAGGGMQLVSASFRLRTEYARGIYFVQPQLLLDYFFAGEGASVQPSFVLNAGILF